MPTPFPFVAGAVLTASQMNSLPILQTVNFQTGSSSTGTTIIPDDDTVPQITEGNEYMTLNITPISASSYLQIDVRWVGSSDQANNMVVCLFVGTTANALASAWQRISDAYAGITVPLTHRVLAGTTSALTFRVRAGLIVANTTTFNGNVGNRKLGGTMASSITITEYSA